MHQETKDDNISIGNYVDNEKLKGDTIYRLYFNNKFAQNHEIKWPKLIFFEHKLCCKRHQISVIAAFLSLADHSLLVQMHRDFENWTRLTNLFKDIYFVELLKVKEKRLSKNIHQ